jgi:Sap, sulfolipid-1-addressing protein
MLTAGLIWTITGLAALDSLNPATIAGVTLILLAPLRRPGLTALAYVAGANLVVLAVGSALFVGSAELGESVTGAATWVRRGALLLAALVLAVTAAKRLRTRTRPRWSCPPGSGPGPRPRWASS